MRQKFVAALFSFFALSPAIAARGPAETVSGFYNLRLQNGSSGVPSGLELAAFSSYLAPELVCMLGAAMRYSDQYAKTLPDKAPPFAEGDLYSSSPLIPSRFTSGSASSSGSKSEVHVRFFRDDTPELSDKGWEDLVHVSLQRRKWLISDIEYKGDFPDAVQGSLLARLRETLTHPDEASRWDPRELSACRIEATPAKSASKQKAKKRGKLNTAKAKVAPRTKAKAAPTKRSASKATPRKKPR